MKGKSTRPTEQPNLLFQLTKELIEDGNQRREEVKQTLRGGLLLKYRPPDATNTSCRLVAYRMDSEPSLSERRTVRGVLGRILGDVPINEPGGVFWHNGFGCYLYTWPPNPERRQLELFAGVGA
jgi:hypothetical protein